MAEELILSKSENKEKKYEVLLPQLEALLVGETDLVANMANTCAALRETFQWWWVGFYLVKDSELVLGPFQGPIACTRISMGRGVCGTVWENGKSLIVDDVDKFPGHIACSGESRSEIVVPLLQGEQVIAVLDVDSEHLRFFDTTDQKYLEKIAVLITSQSKHF